MLIRGDVAGVTVLITVGAVLGKYTPFQLMVMVLMELFFYALNERLVYKVLGAADLGGKNFYKNCLFKKKKRVFLFISLEHCLG